ncbi:MAG: NAD(P)-binding domain-containing protein [Clostridia bacterium]|nr:NAD(P)-binding domain-containing protein [Clostridia bacterium]
MSKITIIGAGKTGRGFIGRLAAEKNAEITFIDKDETLVNELNTKKSFNVSFFGGVREDMSVSGYTAYTWDNADLSDSELIVVSVCGSNLKDVGAELGKLLDKNKHYYIITAENYSKPSKVLKDAIGLDNISVSESTVFCTTIENGGLNISSENYPYLQCDADLLEGYIPDIATIKPVNEFGNFLTRKLFTYNAASCVIAYLGYLKGYTDYAQAANDESILELLDKNYEVTNRVLCQEFGYDKADQEEFAQLSKNKFCDKTIVDTVARNAREPQRKLGNAERIIGPMRLINKYNEDTSVLEMTAAAMLLYDNEGEDEWRKIKTENTPEEILEKICGLQKGSDLYTRILKTYEEMRDKR